MNAARIPTVRPSPYLARLRLPSALALLLGIAFSARGAEVPADAVAHFRNDIQPVLAQYCYDCHADGANKGGVALDELKSEDALVHNPELWWKVLKNVRAGLMPPAKKPQPTADERLRLAKWIKYGAFGIDPAAPDPGRVTLRRLNRAEYRNTIRDLMGVDFRADEEFPPDDTGYGFDTIADVLTVSPLLLEKYMQAAETVVGQAVPIIRKLPAETFINGSTFRGDSGNGDKMSFYKPATISSTTKITQSGD